MSLHLNAILPSLEGATQWINGKPNLDKLNSEPVLVYFWAISCHICYKNMPKLKVLRDTYVPKGLKMIAIHCPRMKSDTDIEKVKAAVEGYGITESCGVDNRHNLKKAFENEIWPAYFLFDLGGHLKRRAAGNAGLSMIIPLLEKMCK